MYEKSQIVKFSGKWTGVPDDDEVPFSQRRAKMKKLEIHVIHSNVSFKDFASFA